MEFPFLHQLELRGVPKLVVRETGLQGLGRVAELPPDEEGRGPEREGE